MSADDTLVRWKRTRELFGELIDAHTLGLGGGDTEVMMRNRILKGRKAGAERS